MIFFWIEILVANKMVADMITHESILNQKDESAVDIGPRSKKSGFSMGQQAKEMALPIGIVITLICAFIGGAVWINSEMEKTRSSGNMALERLTHEVNAMNTRLSGLEASRFTVANGLDVWKEIAAIKERIAAGDPPKWLKDQLDQINMRLSRMEDKIK